MDKNEARKLTRKKRRELSYEDVKCKSHIISEKVIKMIKNDNYENILVYVSINNEVDTSEIIQFCFDNKIKVFVPKVCEKKMNFIQINSFEELKSGSFNIMEPVADNPIWNVNCQKEQKTLMIMPGLAFDRKMGRAGYGGGFYDRFLENCTDIHKTAICYDCQIIEEIDIEKNDIRPDIIVTEKEIIRDGVNE